MKILTKYIIKETIYPFLMSLSIILFIFILQVTMKMMPKFVGKGIEIWVILEFFYLSLGWILALAVPMSVLVASLVAYGRMSQDNEYSILQASGISVYKLMTPTLIMATFLSLGMLYFHNHILPEMNHQSKILKKSISKKKPLALLEPGLFSNEIPGFIIKADSVNNHTNMLEKIIVIDNNSSSKDRRTITAEKGKIFYDESIGRYNIILYRGQISNLDLKKREGYQRGWFDKMVMTKEVKGVSFEVKDNKYYGDREKSTDSLKAKILRLKRRKAPRNLIASVEIEYYKKYALSFACIVMVLIGAPLGLMSGKGGMGASIVFSILIFTVYWFFLMSGEDLGDRGKLNPIIAMWDGNIVIGSLGLFLMYRASKSTKISFIFISNLIVFFKDKFKRG